MGIDADIKENKSFPNLTNETLNIYVPENISSVNIFNINGGKVLTYYPGQYTNKVKIDISELNNGVYIVKCKSTTVNDNNIFLKI
jgi:hypothetical protein